LSQKSLPSGSEIISLERCLRCWCSSASSLPATSTIDVYFLRDADISDEITSPAPRRQHAS
jgi:hypothetical protein